MNVVVISPHPDDETLGSGGTLLKLKKAGHDIYWINVTNVIDNDIVDTGFAEIRKKQIAQVVEKYNFSGCYDFNFSPCSLHSGMINEVIQLISECFKTIKPEMVILPNPSDAHSDHKYVYEAAMSCTKVFRYPYIKKILVMEITSETDFNKYGESFCPNYFVDITDTLLEKIEILKIYDTEIAAHPFPRSTDNIEAMAIVRGATAGVKFAEAFKLIKYIE